MTIKKIVSENGVVPNLCGNGQCPSVIEADNGDIFVQGYVPAASESKVLTAPTGEQFVRMSKATFAKIAGHILAS